MDHRKTSAEKNKGASHSSTIKYIQVQSKKWARENPRKQHMKYKFNVLEHAAGTEDQNMIISSFSRVFSWQYMYVPELIGNIEKQLRYLFPLQLTDFLFV